MDSAFSSFDNTYGDGLRILDDFVWFSTCQMVCGLPHVSCFSSVIHTDLF